MLRQAPGPAPSGALEHALKASGICWAQEFAGHEIAATYGYPSKRIMGSWIASRNYVPNVSAHPARDACDDLRNVTVVPVVKLILNFPRDRAALHD